MDSEAQDSEAQDSGGEDDGSAGAALELALPPGQAARLSRHPALAGGRWHGSARHFVWHDSAEGEMAARGLAVQRSGAVWQLVRLTPDDGFWPPGGPAPILAEGDDPAGFGVAPGLPPLARFEGRMRTRLLSDPGGTRLTVLDGTLRSINQEQACCRVLLAGGADPVAALSVVLGRSLDVAVPTASLAAVAVALARGERPAARHLGAPSLAAGFSVANAFPVVAGHLTDVILYWAPIVASPADQEATEAVHQMRVAMRRLRSALSVFGLAIACPALATLKAELKTLSARLGPARDWDVFATETGAAATAALPQDGGLSRLMEAADRRRRTHHAALRRYLDSTAFRRLGIALAGLAIARPWEKVADEAQLAMLARPLAEHAAEVLRARSRKLMKRDADLSRLAVGELHAIRLQAKRLRYATEFFAPLFPGRATRRFVHRLSRLQERLGHLNDGVVATQLMAELGATVTDEARGLVRGFVAAGARDARPSISVAWKKFRKHQPFIKAGA